MGHSRRLAVSFITASIRMDQYSVSIDKLPFLIDNIRQHIRRLLQQVSGAQCAGKS